MRICIDAQLPPRLARWIADTFSIECATLVAMGLRGADDADIFNALRTPGHVIMSKDADFVDLVTRLDPPPQVIWMTCGNVGNVALQQLLLRAMPEVLRLLNAGEPIVEITTTA